ncbi:MAG: OmpA family protein [Deltaproteobacteria bacterium]|nr:OmpA family protein [Deltaproteobacteria bacterium]
MTRNCIRTILFLMLSTVLVSCAAPVHLNTIQSVKVQTHGYVQKVENFMVILDTSLSMQKKYEGKKKSQLAREAVSLLNRTIPDIKLTGALRTFVQPDSSFKEKTELVYGLTRYSSVSFQEALEAVWFYGGSPVSIAIDVANEDFGSASGRIALIIFSDAKGLDNAPVVSAKKMKSRYGERLCIYTVLVGDDPNGKKIMEGVADASGCGFLVSAKSISTGDGMTDFVKRVFYSKEMRPVDSDGDGVYDDKDRCPGSPEGATVNYVGCWVLKGLRFDTAKWDIKPKYLPQLDELVSILVKNPLLRVEIQGHTDSRGSVEFNQTLSENRAGAVMEYLVVKGIAKERLTAKGFGPSKPVATNDTPTGNEQNRRVELKPIR